MLQSENRHQCPGWHSNTSLAANSGAMADDPLDWEMELRSTFAIREYSITNLGMLKPHDIIVALKLIRTDPGAEPPTYARLAHWVGLSASETHAAVERGLRAGLLRKDTLSERTMPVANLTGLREFLVHGLKYVWPAERGAITRGVPTATSQVTVASLLNVPTPAIPLVWPMPDGTVRGESIVPLHPKAAGLCASDPELHEWLSLMDVIRLKAGREATLAATEIERRLR